MVDIPEHTVPLPDLLELSKLPPLMLRAEVARFARCTTRTVQRAEAAGLLPAARPHRGGSTRVLYRREDVLAWLGIEVTS